jgi:hypothetical protein
LAGKYACYAHVECLPEIYAKILWKSSYDQTGRVGTLHETLILLLEEKPKRNAKLYKKDSENYAYCKVGRKDQILGRGLRSLILFTSKIQTKKEVIKI